MKTAASMPAIHLDKGIYAIVGICKNCGKTSFLNCLISSFSELHLGVMTTGRDGEETDTVFGNPKPAVQLLKGIIFTATASVLGLLGSAVTVLDKLPYSAGNQRLWLLQANRDLETEITGPPTALSQIRTAEIMLARGAQTVLIDGSLERKSVALQPQVKGVFLVAGGSYGSQEQITAELHRLVTLSELAPYPQAPNVAEFHLVSTYNGKSWQPTTFTSLLGNEAALLDLITSQKPSGLYIPGALTDSAMQGLKPAWKKVRSLVVRHPLQIHLSKANLDQLSKTLSITCLHSFRIAALVLNSWSVAGNHLDSKVLRDGIRHSFPALQVLDICEPQTLTC